MLPLTRQWLCILLIGALGLCGRPQLRAADVTAADLLPDTTIIYAELSQPKELLRTVWEHPLRQKIESLDVYRQATSQPQFQQFKLVVSVVENQLGRSWRDAVESLTAGGVYLGVDARTQGAALLIKADSKESLAQIYDTLAKLSQDDAQRKGNAVPWETTTYRDLTVYRNPKASWGLLGPWLVVVNKPELGRGIVDRFLDGGTANLASSQFYRELQPKMKGQTAWAAVNLQTLRTAGLANKLFRGQADNPVGEMLFGGILGHLQHAPWAAAMLRVDPHEVKLALAMPHKAEWIGEARHYFFGADGTAAAPPLITVPGTLFSLSTYRDFSAMWLHAGDLFDEKTQDKFAQAESGLATFFGGKDFGEDILSTLRPEIQFVAVRQAFDDAAVQPAIKLPAFALVFRLKEPEKLRAEFRRTFQSAVGFLNIVGAQNGQPPLDQVTENKGDVQLVGTYYVLGNAAAGKPAPIQANFSPSLAFHGERMVVASTKQLAMTLAEASGAAGSAAMPSTNTIGRLDWHVARDMLADNRETLIAKDMLEHGHARQQAEEQISNLLAILPVFQDATVSLTTADQMLQAALILRTSEAGK